MGFSACPAITGRNVLESSAGPASSLLLPLFCLCLPLPASACLLHLPAAATPARPISTHAPRSHAKLSQTPARPRNCQPTSNFPAKPSDVDQKKRKKKKSEHAGPPSFSLFSNRLIFSSCFSFSSLLSAFRDLAYFSSFISSLRSVVATASPSESLASSSLCPSLLSASPRLSPLLNSSISSCTAIQTPSPSGLPPTTPQPFPACVVLLAHSLSFCSVAYSHSGTPPLPCPLPSILCLGPSYVVIFHMTSLALALTLSPLSTTTRSACLLG